jgi:hypothetical protein
LLKKTICFVALDRFRVNVLFGKAPSAERKGFSLLALCACARRLWIFLFSVQDFSSNLLLRSRHHEKV